VNLDIRAGLTLALIGESGAGKSTLARCLMHLEEPDSGQIWFKGRSQLVFQDTVLALNPRFTAAEIIEEPLRLRMQLPARERRQQAAVLMERVGLSREWAARPAVQFSGGQRQRLAIARALIFEPDFLILDEALSGLDQTAQQEILMLLRDLQAGQPLTYLFITHDVRLAAQFADEIAVMQNGKIVECGPTAKMLSAAQTLYARQLMAAVPGGWN
jgi:peptide/nickel transport system ATP-binding protein